MAGQTMQTDIVLNAIMKIDNAEAGINKLKNSLSKLKMPEGLENSFKKSFANLEGIMAKYKSQLEKGFNTKGDVSAFTKTGKELEVELNRISKNITQLTGKEISFKIKTDALVNAEKKLQDLINRKTELSQKTLSLDIKVNGGKGAESVENLLDKLRSGAGSQTNAGKALYNTSAALERGDLQDAIKYINQAATAYNNLGEKKRKAFEETHGFSMSAGIQELIKVLTKADSQLKVVNGDIDKTEQELSNIGVEQTQKLLSVVNQLTNGFESERGALSRVNGEMQDYARSTQSMAQQLGDLQQSTQYFFSLRNMINLLKRGIDQAVESVKNLDKAMTETAVVTDFNVGDMWGMLPKYTKIANELGATTQGAYETMTLYYQQGLDQQASFEIGAETMKMARIAGLDYAKTTDMMTAALRGFNMELNATSAQRINDVYSELAAKTASNTQEIGEAMERTASIAHSAGMSFEGTSAFLAQMIETTREAPENLGTAMKTIVARFQEMKKNPLEITEVDGEEVSYNKIDTALQTIGVSLKDTNGQFRELDQVFLEIASRWDGLSQTQQRYIATIAAGSRQQSRFIAMMSNYKRTVELMEYANNSAGASQKQFEKTMESFEAKVNKLSNAWQQFTMGIANDKLVKGAIDGFTGILGIVNDLIDRLSLGKGVLKSFLSIFASFTGLKVAGRIINGLVGGLGGLIDPTSGFGAGFKTGATGAGANRITTPIVSKLSDILNAVNNIKNKGIKTEKISNAKYEERKNTLKDINQGNKIKVAKVQETFKGLSQEDQARLFKANRGTMNAIRRSAYTMMDSAFKDNPKMQMLGKTIQTDIFKGMDKGQIKPEIGLKVLGNPSSWGAIAGTDAAKGFSASYQEKVKELSTKAAEKTYNLMNVPLEKRNASGLKELGLEKGFGKIYRQALNNFKKNEGIIKMPTEASLTTMDKFANATSSVGDAFVGAGQSISSFGSLLSQLGGPIGAVGSGLQTLGGVVTNIGMAFGGIGSAISGAQAAAAAMGTTLGAIAGPIIAITAAVGIAAAAFIKHSNDLKKIREEAEEVSKSFEDTKAKITDNISSLQQYQSEFARLAQGVDSNGYNVNLSISDYDKYKEIINKIADINPSIVEGYNAQGLAIINNNHALEDTLTLLKQQERQNVKNYTSVESLQKLINSRNINEGYKKNLGKDNAINPATSYKMTKDGFKYRRGRQGTRLYENTDGEYTYGKQNSRQYLTNEVRQKVPLVSEVNSVLAKIKNEDKINVEEILQDFQIDFQKLQSGEAAEVEKFIASQGDISSRISEKLAENGSEMSDGLTNSFSKLGEATSAFEEAIEPVYQNLLTYVGQSDLAEELPEAFRQNLNEGIKKIASLDLSGTEMQDQADELMKRFTNLTTSNEQYLSAMEIAEKEQDKFALDLDDERYHQKVQKAIDKLEDLKTAAETDTTAAGRAISEFLANEIQKIDRFTEEGSVNLSEALNTATDDIAAAEGAFKTFQETVGDSDFSTAAESMKQIFDEITKETDQDGGKVKLHAQGKGDKTFWTGAEAIFGSKAIKNKSASQVSDMLTNFAPMLEEGQKGFDAFYWHVVDLNEKTKKELESNGVKFDSSGFLKDIPEDQWSNVAKSLGMSEEFLTSMLNKGRQFADINFMNVKDVRKALSTDETVIEGQNGKKKNLYIKKDELKQNLYDAGIVTPKDQEAQIKKLAKEGIITIPSPKALKQDKDNARAAFEDMGIKPGDLNSLIETLDKTGQFNEKEIQNYAKAYLGKDYNKQEFKDTYEEYIKNLENPELAEQNDHLGTIENYASIIASAVVGKEVREGHLNESKGKEANQAIFGKAGVRDTEAQLFSVGKDKEGNPLTEETYKTTRDSVEKSLEDTTQYLKDLREGKKNANTSEEKEKYQEEINTFKNIQDHLTAYLDSGEAAFNKLTGRDKLIEEYRGNVSELGKSGKEAYKYYKENGFGNAGQKERQVLDWGKDPTKNKNFKNYQTWGWEKEDLMPGKNGETVKSTYLSTSEMFGEGKNTVEIAFTPMLQTEGKNGRPEILNKETVHSYLDQIVTQATDESGKINIGELLRLDQGESGITTEDGQPISNLIMGAFTGKNAIETANAFTELEHQLEEAKEKGLSLEEVLGGIKFTPKIEGAKLEKYINKIDGLTDGQKEILLNTEITGEEKATQFLESIEEEFGGVDVEKKKIILEAATEFSQGNEKNGLNLLKKAGFSEEQAQQIKQKLDVAYDPKIINTADFQSSINNQLDKLTLSKNVKKTLKIKAQAELHAKVANSKGKVEYELGKQAKAEDSDAKVYYKLGKQAPPEPKNADVHYKLGSQDDPTSRNITLWATIKDKKSGKVIDADGHAKGMNNIIPNSPLPQFGSAAKGRYGKVGPRGKGGLTLTGEEGFEIAWIPSESRSMILGAGGPQMTNLPSDAVIYTHKQSKEILKRKSIPAGSQVKGNEPTEAHFGKKYVPAYTRDGIKVIVDGKSKDDDKKKPKKSKNDDKKSDKKKAKIIDEAGKVSVWWENQTRKVDSLQRRIDKTSKAFETAVGRFGSTVKNIDPQIKNYISNLKKSIKYNQQSSNKANKDLKKLAGKGGKGTEVSISWERTKIKKTKKGKKKKSKVPTKGKINLANYIRYDEDTGAYVIDQGAINKVAKKNKSKAKAIKEAAQKRLDTSTGRKNTADDNITKAREALIKLSDDIYTTFYQWENSLNKIYFLTKQLSDLSNQLSYQEGYEELLSAKALAGFYSDKDDNKLLNVLEQQKDIMLQQVDINKANLEEAQKAYAESLDYQTYVTRFQNQPDSQKAQDDLRAARWALNLINSGGTFDEKQIANLEKAGYSKESIEKIKEILDNIDEKRSNAIQAATDSQQSITAIYNKLKEYQDYIADFESELVSGIEEQTEKEINRLDKLNSSLSKAFKDLIDTVKRNIDERRKEEDNAKTESDIAKKQQRLSALRADTSGGHAVEIAQLEKEIAEAQQGYQRTLEDQLIDKLQNQGDLAEQQRQQQIDLLNAQKELAAATNSNLEQVKEWLKNPSENKEEIRQAWLANHDYDTATDDARQKLENEFEEAFMKYGAYSNAANQLLADLNTDEKLTDINTAVDNIYKEILKNKDPNTSWSVLKSLGVSAAQAKTVGATAKQLKDAKYSITDIFNAGYTKKQLTDAGITAKSLKKAGADQSKIAKVFGATEAMVAGISGKTVQKQLGTSVKAAQRIINKSSTDAATQKSLAGMSTKIDINGKKKGGKTSATVNNSGKTVTANKGSTLYSQKLDTKTGKTTGKVAKTTIDKLSTKNFSYNKKEATDALVSAIKNTKVGDKINENMKELVAAAGIAGKQYKLKNGIYGSVAKNGKIYFNSGDDGVKIWDTMTGKVTLDKYKKDEFKTKAKNKNVGREYAQVLKKKGVKGYATGGLADQTGPAWLDGTPSKPELVLNAKDTKNFIALKDVLSHIMTSANSLSESYGGNATYEININVDHLNNDYDVDKVAERVKKKIVQDSGYRNVTQVRKFR